MFQYSMLVTYNINLNSGNTSQWHKNSNKGGIKCKNLNKSKFKFIHLL